MSRTPSRRHLRFGWWSLFVFAGLGLVLETLHGLKVGWYLEIAYDARRLMWTLAHAHGTLLALVHIAFAVSIEKLAVGNLRAASSLLTASSLLLPGGFFLGGVFIYDGDPGLGVLLVPLGALCFLVAVFFTARAAGAQEPPDARA